MNASQKIYMIKTILQSITTGPDDAMATLAIVWAEITAEERRPESSYEDCVAGFSEALLSLKPEVSHAH
jgi:hypothetical protein